MKALIVRELQMGELIDYLEMNVIKFYWSFFPSSKIRSPN